MGNNTDENVRCIAKTDEKYISFSKEVTVGKTMNISTGKVTQDKIEYRFLDSMKFAQGSLDKLVGNLSDDQLRILRREMKGCSEEQISLLKRKGVFPYEFMTGFDKLQYPRLPDKKEFHSKLNNTDISDEGYAQAQKVWDAFGCKTMGDYHDLYIRTDVLLLADVMEDFRDKRMSVCGLDALHCYTATGLAW